MWLLIDDIRNLPNMDMIARNSTEAIDYLTNFKFEGVVFDHDLGESISGYDILKWGLENNLIPGVVKLITANPVGRDNMGFQLKAYGYKQVSTFCFEKNI